MRVGEILRLPNTDSILGRGEGRVGCLYREHRSVGDRRFSDGVGSTFVESYTSALFKKSFHFNFFTTNPMTVINRRLSTLMLQ